MLYLIITNITLVIAYVLYRFLFRKLTFFQWNRVYLLSMLVVALLIPVGLYIDLSGHEAIAQQLPTIDLSYMGEVTVLATQDDAQPLRLLDILVPVYWTGFGVALFWFLYRLRYLLLKGRVLGEHESFSFLGKMFLGKEVRDNKTIETHESVHIQQGHTYDILLLETVRCFNWFNPVFYFYRKELKFQHECIADAQCADNKVAYAEMLVAHALKIDDFKLSHSFSNQSFLKKRIMMLFKNKSQRKAKLFYLTTIPALLLIATSTLVFNTSKARHMVQAIEHRIQDVNLPTQENTAYLEEMTTVDQATEEQAIFPEMGETAITAPGQPASFPRITLPKASFGLDTIYHSVAVQPEYPGGMDAFRKFIGEKYVYTQAAIDAGVKGTIEATFVVEKDGSLTDIKILKDLGHGTGEALVELLEKTPKWSPGIDKGKPVRVQYKLPVALNVEGKQDKTKEATLTRIPDGKLSSRSDSKEGEDHDRLFQTVAVPPEFDGGMDAFRRWVGENMVYPQEAVDAGVKGTIELSFIVEKDGSLTDIKVLRDLGYGTGETAIDLFKKSPRWIAGVQNGRKVRVKYKVPITMNLQ